MDTQEHSDNERLIICLNHNYGGTHKVVSFEGVIGPVIDEWFNSLCSFYPDTKVLHILSGVSAGAIISALKLSGLAHRLPAFWRLKILPEIAKYLGPRFVLAKLPGLAGHIARDLGLFRAREEIARILKGQLDYELVVNEPLIIFTTLRRERTPFIFYTGNIPEWLFGNIPHQKVMTTELLISALDASSNTFSFRPTLIEGVEYIDGMFAQHPSSTNCLVEMAKQVEKQNAQMFLSLVGSYNPRKKRNILNRLGAHSYYDLLKLRDRDGIIRISGVDHIAEVFPHLGSPLPSGDIPSEMYEIRKLMREVVKPLIREIEIYRWFQQHEKYHIPIKDTKFNPWHHFRSQSID